MVPGEEEEEEEEEEERARNGAFEGYFEWSVVGVRDECHSIGPEKGERRREIVGLVFVLVGGVERRTCWRRALLFV